MKIRRDEQIGQSLVEMIVIIGMVVLLTTGIVAGTTVSLSRTQITRTRNNALIFAQQGLELARRERDNGWAAFALKGNPQTSYCVGSDGLFTDPSPCSGYNIESKFTRSVILELTTLAGVPTMKVISQITWGDVSNPNNTVKLTTYLTQWR